MAGGDVADLRVDLKLNNAGFKREINSVRADLRLLQAQFKSAGGNDDLAESAETLKANLQAQIDAVGGMVDTYKKRIEELKNALTKTAPGSKQEAGLLGDLKSVETSLANAKGQLEELEKQLNEFDLSQFKAAVETVVGITRDLDMAYNGLIGDWANETADAADEIYVAREHLDALVKEALDTSTTEAQAEEFAQWTRDLIANEVPVSFERAANAERHLAEAGIPLNNGLKELTRTYLKLEAVSEDLNGEDGATSLAQIVRLTRTATKDYDNLGSVIAGLSDKTSANASQLLEMTKQTASAGAVYRMGAQDLLAYSAAALDFGQNEEAAGTAFTRILMGMGTAAESAGAEYDAMLSTIQEIYPEIKSIYEFTSKESGTEGQGMMQALVDATGFSQEDLNAQLDRFILLEKYAQMMGMGGGLGEQITNFSNAWNNDAGATFLAFFDRLAAMDAEGLSSVVATLEGLGISNIRTGLLGRNFAVYVDRLHEIIDLSDMAFEKGTLLDEKSGELFDTTQSRRQFQKNIKENMQEGMGRGVAALRAPFDQFFADLRKQFTESLPEWVQTGVGATIEFLGGVGDALGTVGDWAESIYYTTELIGKVKETNWKSIVEQLGGALSKLGGVGVTAGFLALAGLVAYINDLAVDTGEISKNLANLEIRVDEESKRATLAAIEEVKAAAKSLTDSEFDEKYANVSAVVQGGFGTMEMFGQALQYEAEVAERRLQDIYGKHGETIREIQAEMTANADNPQRLAELQRTYGAVTSAMEKEANQAKREYSETLGKVVAGALEQAGFQDEAQEFARKYNFLDDLLGLSLGNEQATAQKIKNYARRLWEAGAMDYATYEQQFSHIDPSKPWADSAVNAKALEPYIKNYYDTLLPYAEKLLGNSAVVNIMQQAFTEGVLNNLDPLAAGSSYQGLMGLLDVRQIAETGASSFEEIGKNSVLGLGEGWSLNDSGVIDNVNTTCNDMLAAARAVLDIHSPSRAMAEIGGYAVSGLAEGILSGKDGAVGAIQDVMGAMLAEAESYAGRIAAVIGGAGGMGGIATGVPGTAGSPANRTTNNYFNISGSNLQTQQNIKRLAQQIDRVQRLTNASIGKG